MLFNDFLIKETPADEVQALFGGQKTPCLLYYTQARLRPGCKAPLQDRPAPAARTCRQSAFLAAPSWGHLSKHRNGAPVSCSGEGLVDVR